MNNMAEYALIFQTGTSDEWVEKRIKAVADMKAWLEKLTPSRAIVSASAIATSIGSGEALVDEIAIVGEGMIRKHALSFVRSVDEGELQIKVFMAAAAIALITEAADGDGWTTADALAAAFWSALWYQRPVEQAKVEALRQDLLTASRTRVLKNADTARKRRPIPAIGQVNVDQSSASGSKVNAAFSRAVEPMVTAMRDNAALDREELDFMWWLLSERSDILDEPLAGLSGAVRAVSAALDAAAKLRKLPADAHRNIVLRNVLDGDPLSLTELIAELGDRRPKLATSLGVLMGEAPAVFPLIMAISTGKSDGPLADEKFAASEWGGRALLEGAIHHIHANTAGGL